MPQDVINKEYGYPFSSTTDQERKRDTESVTAVSTWQNEPPKQGKLRLIE